MLKEVSDIILINRVKVEEGQQSKSGNANA